MSGLLRITEDKLEELGLGLKKLEDLLDLDKLLSLGLDYGIIYKYDAVEVGPIKDISLDKDNLMEAIFFSKDREVKLLKRDGELQYFLFAESEDREDKIDKKGLLYPRGEGYSANKMLVRKYIDYSQDNQAYISYTRPIELIFEEGK